MHLLLLFSAAILGVSCTHSPVADLPTSESGGPADPTGLAVTDHQTLPPIVATVERVVDGDTIIVSVDDKQETVRLLGIDTPEKAGGPRPAECFGSQASAYAAELLPPGTRVRLSRDHETRDQYGRLLAFVHRVDDDTFVNRAMVETGHATALFFSPNTTAREDFTAAADSARRDWIGFWAECGSPDVVLPTDS